MRRDDAKSVPGRIWERRRQIAEQRRTTVTLRAVGARLDDTDPWTFAPAREPGRRDDARTLGEASVPGDHGPGFVRESDPPLMRILRDEDRERPLKGRRGAHGACGRHSSAHRLHHI